MMKSVLRSVTAMIPTGGSLEEALDFYVRHMGFSIVWQSGGMAGIRRDGVAFTQPASGQIRLTWNASTDNVGVTAYDVYANNVLRTSVSGTTLTYTDSQPDSATVSYFVRAREILRTDPATAPARAHFEFPARSPDFLCPVPLTSTPTIEEQLDQLWDLLRRRRAAKLQGVAPDEVEAHSIDEVERYLQ